MILTSEISKIAELQNRTVREGGTGFRRDSLSGLPELSKHALIITGIRRCGKSTLLSQLISEKYPDAFFINFDDNRLYGFENSDFFRLDEVVAKQSGKVLMFDELQEIVGWERYVRQKLDENYKVIITGSNASLLSRELGTKLTGRHISRELFPYSYSEFIFAASIKADQKSLTEYLELGGFPEYINTRNSEILSQLFDDIIIRDIVVRYGVRDIKNLQRLALYLISNIGKPVTGSKLKKVFGIASTSTIMEYFSHFESAYLFQFIPKFSYSAKAQLINPRKVYAVDNGLIGANSNSFSEDRGRKLENAVFNYLRLSNREIFYFLEDEECDFIVFNKGRKPSAIQVCYDLTQENLTRELKGLYKAMNFFGLKEGVIITMGQKERFRNNGLIAMVQPAHEFLAHL
jgi:hypothetical protein